MIYLVLDTSSTNLIVSLAIDDKILYFYKCEDVIEHSTMLLKEIDTALKQNKLSISDIGTIFVVNGPGSFTGLRVGVTLAKVLAYALKIKIIPISSLEWMATTEFNGDYIVPYIDARRGYIYAGVYDKNLHPVIEDQYISVTDCINSLPKTGTITFVGNAKVKGIETFIKSEENVISIINKHKNDEGMNPHLVNPNYLKRVEAEERLHDSKNI